MLGNLEASDLAHAARVSRAFAEATQSASLPLRRRQLIARLESPPSTPVAATPYGPTKRVEAAWRGHLVQVSATQGAKDALWAIGEVAGRWPWSAAEGPQTYGDGFSRPLAAALAATDEAFARLYPTALDLLSEATGGSTARLEAVLGPAPWEPEADPHGETWRALLREAMRDAVADNLAGTAYALVLHVDVGADAVLAYARARDAGDRALEEVAMGLCLVWQKTSAELPTQASNGTPELGEDASAGFIALAALPALQNNPFVRQLLAAAPDPIQGCERSRAACTASTLAAFCRSYAPAVVDVALARAARPLHPVQRRTFAFFAAAIAAPQHTLEAALRGLTPVMHRAVTGRAPGRKLWLGV